MNNGPWRLGDSDRLPCARPDRGGTARDLAEVEGWIESRQILNLTIIFDHDVIDGAPAARFTRRLVELIEGGYGLEQDQTITAAEASTSADSVRVPA